MQIEINLGTLLFIIIILGLLSALIIERFLGWYFKKCIKLGMQEYQGKKIHGFIPDQGEKWQRVYMYYIQKPITLALIQQMPYYVMTIIILIVIFVPWAIVDPTVAIAPIWVLFPFWIVILTCTTYARASKKSQEYGESE
ncbi:MAG: hypothetical protein ACFFCT_14975 [Candidatus Odinarchaeota archaeon]